MTRPLGGTEVPALDVAEMLRAFAARELSPLDALPADEDPHDAWAARCLSRARAEARAAEQAWRRGEPTGPLCGVPFAAKDLLDTAGLATECGSRLLAGRVPARDAAAVAALRRAGAVLAGKTTTVEFAWGLMMRTARNPHDPQRTPGGSSGGSAIAVATGAVPLALGTDTGGSIRLPAGFCGIVGFKPSHGAVPARGCWPLAPSMDCVGPMTRSAADAALALAVLTGRPPAGPAGLPHSPRIGCPSDLGVALPRAVAAALRATADRLRAAGAEVVDVPVPGPRAVMDAYMPGFLRQALAVHAEAGLWPARAGEYTPAVRRRLELAEAQTPEAVAAGVEAATRLRAAYERVWQQVDLLLTPVCAVTAPRLDDPATDLRDAASPLVCAQNLLGLPACAVPAGTDGDGLPVGVQLSGPRGHDDRVLQVAAALTG